jgi:hypothetical protein
MIGIIVSFDQIDSTRMITISLSHGDSSTGSAADRRPSEQEPHPLRGENAKLCAKLLEGVDVSHWLVTPSRKKTQNAQMECVY